MNSHALLGLSALMSFVASAVAASLWIAPRLRMKNRIEALVPLVAPHMFFRTIGLSFLVPGVVSPSLSAAFAVPAAYGDFVAGILAIAATLALAKRASWAIVLVWVFNVWGAGDLLNAIYQGNVHAKIDPATLGAAFYIPTAVVPPLLVTCSDISGSCSNGRFALERRKLNDEACIVPSYLRNACGYQLPSTGENSTGE